MTRLALLCRYQDAVTFAAHESACLSMHVANFVALAFAFELWAVTCLALLCGYQGAVTFAAHESLFVDACCELGRACSCIRALGSDLFGTAVRVPKCCHLGCA